MGQQSKEETPGPDPIADGNIFDKIFFHQPTTKYRETTLGKVLIQTLDELRADGRLPDSLRDKVLCTFDRSILFELSQRLKTRITFKASKLHTYRFLDGTWTFLLDEVEFRQYTTFVNVPRLKIMAFYGKVPHPKNKPASRKRKKGDCIAAAASSSGTTTGC